MICIVAKIVQGKQLSGYRLVQYDYDTGKTLIKDIGVDVLKNAMKSGLEIQNAAIVSNEITGTNGTLDRLANFAIMSGKIIGRSPLVILYKLGDVGYVVSDGGGNVRKLPIEKVLEYSKENGIANGKVVKREDGTEFVSAINGEYEVKEVKKTSRNTRIDRSEIVNDKERRAYAPIINNSEADVSENLAYTDVFKTVNQAQKAVIKEYYVYVTIEIYKELKQGVRLNVPPKKVQQLAELRGTDEWDFYGAEDAGYFGADKCSLGHSLRWVYRAVHKDEDGTEHILKFGSTCASDFIQISEEGMKKLVKMTNVMSTEMDIISNITANNLYDEAWNNVSLLKSMVDRLKDRGESGILQLISLFGKPQAKYLIKFEAVNIPYPASLCRRCIENLKKVKIADILNILEPSYTNFIKLLNDNNCFENAKYSCKLCRGFFRYLNEYLEFLFRNQLEGIYSYDPINNIGDRGKGRFTKESRYARKSLLRNLNFVLGVSEWNLEELDGIVEILKILYEASIKINNEVESYGYQACDVYVYEQLQLNTEDQELKLALKLLENSLILKNNGYSNLNLRLGENLNDRGYGSLRDWRQYLNTYRLLENTKYKEVIEEVVQYRDKKKREEEERLALEKRELEIREANRKQKQIMIENTVCTLNCKYQNDGICDGLGFERLYNRTLLKSELQDESEVRLVTTCEEFCEIEKEEGKPEVKSKDKNKEDSSKDRAHKSGEDKSQILEELKKLIEEFTDVKDYSIDISKAILEKGTKYSDLSYKQSYIINRATSLLAEHANSQGKEVDVSKLNITKLLKDSPEVKKKVDKIVEYLNSKDKTVELSSKEVAITESVNSRGKFSAKQLKYIEEAYNKIKNL